MTKRKLREEKRREEKQTRRERYVLREVREKLDKIIIK